MILETADLHLNNNPRDAYRHVFMEQTLPGLLHRYHASVLVILGDLCDEKDRHPAVLVNRMVGQLIELSKHVSDIFILRGNHDYIEAAHPFYQFLGTLPKISWINTPLENHLFGSKVLFLPHTADYRRDWKGRSFKGYARIYAHQTFQGADVGPRKLEGIPLDIFPDNARIVSGDVHVPQTFDIVTYVGAPYLCDFGDDYRPRVLLRDSKGSRSVLVPGIQKRLVEINSLAELKSISGMLGKGDILKVRLALTAADHGKWPTMKAQVQEWAAQGGYQLYMMQPAVTQGQVGKATARQRSKPRTDEELMRLYAKARAVSEATLETGLELMNKV